MVCIDLHNMVTGIVVQTVGAHVTATCHQEEFTMPIHSPSHIAVEDLCEFMYFSSFIYFFLHFVLSTVVGNRNVFPLPFLSVSHCNMSISFLPFFYSAPHKSFHCWFSFLTIQIRTIFLSHFPSFFSRQTHQQQQHSVPLRA